MGGLAGAYIAGGLQNDSWDPTEWNWHDLDTWNSVIAGSITGSQIGYGLGQGIANFVSSARFNAGHLPTTATAGRRLINAYGGISAINSRNTQPTQVAYNTVFDENNNSIRLENSPILDAGDPYYEIVVYGKVPASNSGIDVAKVALGTSTVQLIEKGKYLFKLIYSDFGHGGVRQVHVEARNGGQLLGRVIKDGKNLRVLTGNVPDKAMQLLKETPKALRFLDVEIGKRMLILVPTSAIDKIMNPNAIYGMPGEI